jgi:hypothetical protein
MTTFFPNPCEQAIALLSDCKDNLEEARGLARMQALMAHHDEMFLFWIAVRDYLIPEKGAQA